MKMVKSLLLGSAAGVAAVAGARAADLPVKAAPVQYVKICTLYGVGFCSSPAPTLASGSVVGSALRQPWHTNGYLGRHLRRRPEWQASPTTTGGVSAAT